MIKNTQCIFCKIVEGKEDKVLLYEDNYTLAFLDKKPFNLGHTLVIPKKHYKYITNMGDKEICNLFRTVNRLARAVFTATKADGLNIGQSNGLAASQQIFHVHVHIIPRFIGDSNGVFPNRKQINLIELKKSSRDILEELNTKEQP